MMRTEPNRWGALWISLVMMGCTGTIGTTDDSEPPDPIGDPTVEATPEYCADAPISVGAATARRLTHQEYGWAIADLLGLDEPWDLGSAIEDGNVAGFAGGSNISTVEVRAFQGAAAEVAAALVQRLDTLLPCAADANAACARQFVEEFVARAFRRPLRTDEVDAFTALYATAEEELSLPFAARIGLIAEAALQSPSFLFRIEEESLASPGDIVAVQAEEIAARLSFFLWRSVPDPQLLDAAARGALETPDQIEAEARRMLADPRAERAVADFHLQWLGATTSHLNKPDEEFVAESVQGELSRFVIDTIFRGDGRLPSLLTASHTFADANVARLYGLRGEFGREFARVELDPEVRAGVLTMPAVLGANTHDAETSHVFRGKLIRERFICQTMPSPPANAIEQAPTGEGLSSRQFSERVMENPICGSCHRLLDPLGLSFSAFDASGRFTEGADVSGAIIEPGGSGDELPTVAFSGVRELATHLAGSATVHRCVAENWLTYAVGRRLTEEDQCSLAEVYQRFADSDLQVQELIIAIVRSDAFRLRTTGEGGVCR